MTEEILTRREIVRRELDTAIDLYLKCKDSVSAHVLASAASEVLRGLGKYAGIEPLDSQIEKAIAPGKEKAWRAAVNRHYNFFKHSDRDPQISDIAFDSEITTYEIFAGIQDYQRIFGQISMPMALFRGYMVKTRPEMFTVEYLALVQHGLWPFDVPGKTIRETAADHLALYDEAVARGDELPDGVEKVAARRSG